MRLFPVCVVCVCEGGLCACVHAFINTRERSETREPHVVWHGARALCYLFLCESVPLQALRLCGLTLEFLDVTLAFAESGELIEAQLRTHRDLSLHTTRALP